MELATSCKVMSTLPVTDFFAPLKIKINHFHSHEYCIGLQFTIQTKKREEGNTEQTRVQVALVWPKS